MEIRSIIFAAAILICAVGGLIELRPQPQSAPAESPLPIAKQTAVRPAPPIVFAGNFPDDNVGDLLQRATNAIATSPGEALALGRQLLAADPADENGRLAIFLNALCNSGQFQTALDFAGEAPPGAHPDWVRLIFNRWAQSQPQDALKSLAAIADPEQHGTAFRALVDGWNASDPAGLAAHAIVMSAGDDRDLALEAALDNWSLQDPAGLAAWLNTLPRGIEFDTGASMMIAKTDGANRTPELAMHWVENINDPVLKENSFRRVLEEWRQTDAAAAQAYVASANWLDAGQRASLLKKPAPQD